MFEQGLRYYDQEITDFEEKIYEQIIHLSNLTYEDFENKVKEIEENISRANKELKKMKRERKRNNGSYWEDKINKHTNELNRYESILKDLQVQAQRKQLLDEQRKKTDEEERKTQKKTEKNRTEPCNVVKTVADSNQRRIVKDKEMEDALFGEIYKILDDQLHICEQLKKQTTNAMKHSTKVAEILKQQKEQLQKIDDDMDKLGANTTRAGRELNTILRRMATDKCFLVFVCLFILTAIFAFVALIVKKVVPVVQKPGQEKPVSYFQLGM